MMMNLTGLFTRRAMFRVALLFALALTASMPSIVQAQTNPEIADCEEIKDEATQTQAEICSAHIGCKFVFAIQNTCVKAKRFLNNLRDAIGEGTKGFFGTRKEVTPDAVFEASLTEKTIVINTLPESKDMAARIRNNVRETKGGTLSGKASGDISWVYYGETKNDKAEGTGTRVFSDGWVQRGKFSENLIVSGPMDSISPEGTRVICERTNEKCNGAGAKADQAGSLTVGRFENNLLAEGKVKRADGTRFEGRFRNGIRAEGKEYRADGSIAEEGHFDNGTLSIGKAYYRGGTVIEIDKPRDRELAATAARETEERRKRDLENERLASEQLKRDEADRAAQAFRDSLKSMNAGQLFAKADELSTSGDKVRSREVLRSLIARFPDHKLAENAAEQLAGGREVPSSATANATATSTGRSNSAATLSVQECDQKRAAIRAQGLADITKFSHEFAVMRRLSYANYQEVKTLFEGQCAHHPKAYGELIVAKQAIEREGRQCAELGEGPNCEGPPARKNPTVASGGGTCAQQDKEIEAEFVRRNGAIPSNDNVARLALVRSVSLRMRDAWLPCDTVKAKAYEKTAADTLVTCRQIASNESLCTRN